VPGHSCLPGTRYLQAFCHRHSSFDPPQDAIPSDRAIFKNRQQEANSGTKPREFMLARLQDAVMLTSGIDADARAAAGFSRVPRRRSPACSVHNDHIQWLPRHGGLHNCVPDVIPGKPEVPQQGIPGIRKYSLNHRYRLPMRAKVNLRHPAALAVLHRWARAGHGGYSLKNSASISRYTKPALARWLDSYRRVSFQSSKSVCSVASSSVIPFSTASRIAVRMRST